MEMVTKMAKKMVKKARRIQFNRTTAIMLMVTLLISSCVLIDNTGLTSASNAAASAAKAKVNATSGAYLRSKPSVKSSDLGVLKHNTSLTVNEEVFTKTSSTKLTTRWYNVTANGKTGYIRADLVKSMSYNAVTGVTTDALNYRSGPSTTMARKGTFKKNSKVTVVLNASTKSGGGSWYKVKVGSAYYYASADWIKIDTAQEAASEEKTESGKDADTKEASSKTTLAATAAPTVPVVKVLPAKPVISAKNVTYPKTILQGMGYGLGGTVICDRPIETAKFGVRNASGSWVIKETREVGNETFDISSVDAAIRFGTLGTGSYKYVGYVIVEGKTYKVVNYSFTVKKGTGGQKLTATALNLAWPKGTSKSKYKKAATTAYKLALDAAYPGHKKWRKGARTGASCDVFVGTVCRTSGIDPNMPRTVGDIWSYLPKHPEKWAKLNYHYKESELKSGDIIIYYYKKARRGKHVCMYVEINGKGYIAEANYVKGYYGYITSSKSKIFRASDKKKFAVYRCVAGGSSSAPAADTGDNGDTAEALDTAS